MMGRRSAKIEKKPILLAIFAMKWRAARHSNPRWLFDAGVTESIKDNLIAFASSSMRGGRKAHSTGLFCVASIVLFYVPSR